MILFLALQYAHLGPKGQSVVAKLASFRWPVAIMGQANRFSLRQSPWRWFSGNWRQLLVARDSPPQAMRY